MKTYDVVGLGELLIDFTPSGFSESGMQLFEQNPGGAPANMICALARFGRHTAYIGKVGNDMHGDLIRRTLSETGVDVSGVISTSEAFTTLAFVKLEANGEREFSFARKPGADICLCSKDIDKEILRSTKIFHFGSISTTHEPARSATLYATQTAKKAGSIISYDPNYRPPLWAGGREQAAKQILEAFEYVDILKLSQEECALVTGISDPRDAAKHFSDTGIPVVVVTLGKKGSCAYINGELVTADAISYDAVDTTGAGDAFWGGFLSKFLEKKKNPKELSAAEGRDCLMFGSAAAALCICKRGGIPALPSLNEVVTLYKNRA